MTGQERIGSLPKIAYINYMISIRSLFIICLCISIVSLAGALIAQYGFGLMPCELCLMQRVPYAVIIAISLLGIFWQKKFLAILIAISFLTGSGIASYHVAVEKHWVKGPTACVQDAPPPHQSIDDLLKQIEAAPIVACDQPQWEYRGITMAGLNALWSFMLAIFVIIFLRKIYAHTTW